jgi:hypothetical protein
MTPFNGNVMSRIACKTALDAGVPTVGLFHKSEFSVVDTSQGEPDTRKWDSPQYDYLDDPDHPDCLKNFAGGFFQRERHDKRRKKVPADVFEDPDYCTISLP